MKPPPPAAGSPSPAAAKAAAKATAIDASDPSGPGDEEIAAAGLVYQRWLVVVGWAWLVGLRSGSMMTSTKSPAALGRRRTWHGTPRRRSSMTKPAACSCLASSSGDGMGLWVEQWREFMARRWPA